MTSDQGSFPEILDGDLAVSAGTDWSNATAIQARGAAQVFEQGDLQGRAGFLRDRSDSLSTVKDPRRHKRVALPYASMTRQVYASAHEDIARLDQILRGHRCAAVLRGSDGVELQLDTPALRSHGATPSVGLLASESSASRAIVLNAPIYGADGCLLATLEFTSNDCDRSDSSAKLLRALLEATARATTERWFRLVHRRDWVIAAMRRKAPDTCILLALDREQRLLGADRRARELLGSRGRSFDKSMRLSELFQPSRALLQRRGCHDVSTTLLAPGDGDPWIALITPPDIGAPESCHDARVLLHARPRLDSLGHLWAVSTMGRHQSGLSRESRKLIEEYIDTHLDTALELEKLAALVGLSPSYFTRSFYKAFGLTPHRYVVHCRVLRAQELMLATQLPLTEIALTVGFADQSHFSRRFTEVVGVTPGAFRASNAGVPHRPTPRRGASTRVA
jgi:AraC-like DNA-binding protein